MDEVLTSENSSAKTPLILFKYLDIKGAKAMLSNSNIQFTNATRLNDPFDCHPSLIDFSKITLERCKGWSPEDARLLESDQYRRYRERAWICCLSKVHDSILMWSYYNAHKGVCIGLDMEKVKKYLHPLHGMMVFNTPLEVVYRDVIEKPDYFADPEDFFRYQICTKAKEWAHEQEARMIILDPSRQYMTLPHELEDENEMIDWEEVRSVPKIGGDCFAAIYLGIKIREKEKKSIIKLARKLNPGMKIYQMEVNPDAFKLDSVEKFYDFH